MSFDDIWNEVTILKKSKKQLKKDKLGNKEAIKRSGITNEKVKLNNLDNSTETVKHKTIPLEWGKKISEARQQKKMRQKDLASRINEQVSIINHIECGKAQINHKVLTKIENVLGIRVRNKNKN